MKTDKLDAIGYIDDQLIEKAETYTAAKRRPRMKWLALAACIPLVFAVTAFASEAVRYNAAVGYLTSLGIPVEDLSDYSRKEIKDAARIIAAEETLAVGESNALVDDYYNNSRKTSEDLLVVPTKITSDQVKALKPTMTRAEVLKSLGDTIDVGSGFYIYEYEVDQHYLLRIPFAGDDAQLGVNGEDLLKALEPIEK